MHTHTHILYCLYIIVQCSTTCQGLRQYLQMHTRLKWALMDVVVKCELLEDWMVDGFIGSTKAHWRQFWRLNTACPVLQFGGHGPYQLKIQILSSGRPVIGIKEASSGMDSDRNSA